MSDGTVHHELLDELQRAVGDVYAIERELGGGGMSRVFLATERSLGRRVVIKLLPPEMVSGVSEARFRREILVTANLQHPHILPVLAVGTHSDLHYYVTPFIEGQSLRDRLVLQGALPVSEAIDFVRELASALAHAHAHGIIHRDIKPENILLSGGHVVLADFGIAGAIARVTEGERLTGTGQGPGTPGYMAPEQLVDASAADPRVDVFTLGVVAYEMFTGKAPFSGSTPHALAASYFTDPPPPLEQVNPQVPRSISAAITRAMATAPEDRFGNAGEFLAALRTTQADVPAVAPAGRRKAMMAAVGLLALATLGAATLLSRRPETAAPDDATSARKMLAVLPFKNLGAPEDAYFADGVTEEVTTRLASLGGLGVISRTSADQYANSTKPLRTIASELGADYVLEGSVRWQRTGNGRGRVRVTPQLIRVSDDTHLWVEQFDAELQDVFMVQTHIAEKVAGALAVALPGAAMRQMAAQPTANFTAYDAYMRGERIRTREGTNLAAVGRAEKLLLEAVTADPRFALAFSRLALLHMRMYEVFQDRTPARLAAARAAADSAIALDPSLPEGHLALGRYFEGIDDLESASVHYAHAERGRPNDAALLTAHASVEMRRGQWKESLARFRRAVELDPRSAETNLAAAHTFGFTRDYKAARTYAQRAIAADSELVDAYIMKARFELAASDDWAPARETVRAMLLKFGAERPVATEGFDLLIPVLDSSDLATVERVPRAAFGGAHAIYYYWRTELFERRNRARARAYADTLMQFGQRFLDEQPDSYRVRSASGWANAHLGKRDAAIADARRAIELAPRSGNTLAWAEVNTLAAVTFMHLGDHEAAITQLEQLLDAPSWLSASILRRDPLWNPLRDNPRFQRLLQRKV